MTVDKNAIQAIISMLELQIKKSDPCICEYRETRIIKELIEKLPFLFDHQKLINQILISIDSDQDNRDNINKAYRKIQDVFDKYTSLNEIR